MNEIIAYGSDNGFSEEQVQIAVDTAFIESSLGQNLNNPNSTASGLFQYLDGSWESYHSGLGEKNDQSNQITAFYNDLSIFSNWYSNPNTNGNIPNDMSLGEYTYTKHHDGRNYSDFENAPGRDIYNNTIGDGISYLSVNLEGSGSGSGKLCVNSDEYIGDGAAMEVGPVGCIQLKDESDPSSVYIDYEKEAGLSDSDRQNIIDVDPVGAFYICDD